MLYVIRYKEWRYSYQIDSFWHDKQKAIDKAESLIECEHESIIVQRYSMAPNGSYKFEENVYTWRNDDEM